MRHEIFLVSMNNEFLYTHMREICKRGAKKELFRFLRETFPRYSQKAIREQRDEIWESFNGEFND